MPSQYRGKVANHCAITNLMLRHEHATIDIYSVFKHPRGSNPTPVFIHVLLVQKIASLRKKILIRLMWQKREEEER